MQTLAQFASKMHSGAGVAVRTGMRKGVQDAALFTKRSVQAELIRAGVSGGKLRNVGVRGSRVGVRYDNVVGTDNPSVTVRATGRGFHLLERDTRSHVITPRVRGRRALANAARRGERSTNRRALAIPGVGPRARVQHPGTKGKHPFERGVELARLVVHRIIATSFFRELG